MMMERLALMIRKLRVGMAEAMLPDRYYVQEHSFASYYRREYPDFAKDIKIFNKRPDKLNRDANRWFMIRMLLEHLEGCEKGEYAELGTYRGMTARLIMDHIPEDSRLYCFDTFEGFAAADVKKESEHSSLPVQVGDYGNTDLDAVVKFVTGANNPDRLVLRKGFFPETAKGLEAVQWRFVHLDCDLAAPTKAGLEFFWENLVPGGVILIHDFFGGFKDGVQAAFADFSKRTGCVAIPMTDGGGSAVITKPAVCSHACDDSVHQAEG